ncbi:phosphatase PAP2 family protein [Mucilaginibacter gotjawali]|uniref:Membrane-associated phospholipid phosphatase n=2 Tax=Mucilaginibacter gotjawali TaxID=1550579 RepID=A0A839S9X8_9SPHI|nr:phosphatase PAP2 family protein [Mucilaginibacter gotjawali]MBB3054164.1 membrane-associated phospholipid phosphatase [Mucilaginibacter gotjawali]BAU54435.1 PAP2 superfamily protein [Mucilaginibacter gotjawali]
MGTAFSIGVKTTIRQGLVVFAISVAYLLISYWLVGFKTDQLFLIGLFNLLFYLSPVTRKFILGFSIFIVYWIIFDYMKAFPNYNYNTVHIADLYNFEKHLFGINYNGKLITPNEYWRLNGNTFLDIMGGIFYLCWIPVPLAFAAYLFFKDSEQFLHFSFTFVLVNFLGFIIYYLYPAAPPWYVEYHGFTFIPGTHGNTAGLVKFDQYFNAGIFKSIYSKGSNVFAAMPSLHSSYPVIVLYYSFKNRMGFANIFFVIVMLGIWFTAVYASHHYIADVIAGIICAITGIIIFNILLKRVTFFGAFLKRYQKSIQ